MKSMKSLYNTTGYWGIPARMGIRLLQNVSTQMCRHDVFYDHDLDRDVDLLSIIVAALTEKF